MLTLIALSAALMQDPPAPPHPPATPEAHAHFAFVGGDGPGRLDADGDGQITREEFSAPMTAAFGRMDKDGDGRLSTEEMAQAHGPDGDHGVMIMRGMADGEPHRFELRRPHPGGEGVRVERDGERTMVFVGEGGRGDGEIVVRGLSGGGHPRIMRLPHGDMGPGEHRIEIHALGEGGPSDLDKDEDGKISEAEFVAPLREAFARMDADRSGFVEEGERGRGGEVQVFTHRIETREAE